MNVVDKEKITKILTAAIAAPSGDNSQPWRFVFREPNILEFYAIPENDNALLNIDSSGTLIALGAAIQNAELEAKALGFNPEIRYGREGSLVATFTLDKEGKLSEIERTLQQTIPLRHTNRKAYKKTPLAKDERQTLFDAAGKVDRASFILIEDRESMTPISRALTTMEEIALKNKLLHKFFFGSIFWSKERNAAGVPGLYIETLELPPTAKLLFKVLCYWPVAKLLARVGFPKMVAETNAKQNASASAFGVIIINKFDRIGYIEAGRLLERIWLAATARGLSLQIITGLLFLARAIENKKSSIFSNEERTSVSEACAKIRENLEGPNEPFLMFRVGYSEAPSAVSFRQSPVADFK